MARAIRRAVDGEVRVATVQLAAWNDVRRGAIDATLVQADRGIADAALARVMLCRRRAVTASVLDAFFAAVGRGFEQHHHGRQPLDRDRELAEAAKAADIVAAFAGDVGPLYYERALLARARGRTADALHECTALLTEYPGFVAAAIETARLDLAAGDPIAAMLALAPVEKEVRETRAGAGVLADALRAVGRPADAARYDLAALLVVGHRDSRGNDCAPDDVSGRPVVDRRMPTAFTVAHLPDGRFLMNDRGLYFIATFPLDMAPLADLLGSVSPDGDANTKPRRPIFAALRETAENLAARARVRARESLWPELIDLLSRLRRGRDFAIDTIVRAVRRATRRFLRRVVRPFVRRVVRQYLFPLYKALPEPVRAANHRYILQPLPAWQAFFARHSFELIPRDAVRRLADNRANTWAHSLGFEFVGLSARARWLEQRRAEGILRIIEAETPPGQAAASDRVATAS